MACFARLDIVWIFSVHPVEKRVIFRGFDIAVWTGENEDIILKTGLDHEIEGDAVGSAAVEKFHAAVMYDL